MKKIVKLLSVVLMISVLLMSNSEMVAYSTTHNHTDDCYTVNKSTHQHDKYSDCHKWISDGRPCPTCYGSGRAKCDSPTCDRGTCNRCGGDGYLDTLCPTCDGETGVGRTCKVCGGTNDDCPYCFNGREWLDELCTKTDGYYNADGSEATPLCSRIVIKLLVK